MSNGEIGVGVIGMNPTNMGSTMTLVQDDPEQRFVIKAMCARREDVLKKYAEEIGVPFWTTDYRELCSRDDVDVVCVYSPDHLHAEHCSTAIQNGKHVVCTKPMVTNLEDAKMIVKLVREKGVKFLVGQTMRFDRQFGSLRKMYADGEFGELMAAEAHYVHDMRGAFETTPWRLEVPQDLMFGGCVHPIDILRCFLGDVDEVHAYGVKSGVEPRFPYENNFFINLKFKSGPMARVAGLYGIVHPPMPMMQVGLYGTKASVQADFTDNEPGQVRVVIDGPDGPKLTVTDYEAEKDTSAYGHGATVIRYMKHFQDCLDEDKKPSPDEIDGAKSIAVGVAAWESVKTGKPVKVFNEF